jgi:hypothetical protein
MHVRTLFNHRLVRAPDGTLQAVEDSKIKVSDRGVLKFRSDWLERPPLNSQLVALIARWLLNRDLHERVGDTVDYMGPGSTKDEALWNLTDDLVGETIRTLRTAGIAYVRFLIPTSVELGSTQWRHVNWRPRRLPASSSRAFQRPDSLPYLRGTARTSCLWRWRCANEAERVSISYRTVTGRPRAMPWRRRS